MLQKGAALQEFQKDITRAFSSTNVPLEKLGHVEMKEFFAKYVAQYPLVHPNNYRGTWLPKVGDERRAEMERIFRKREHFIVMSYTPTWASMPTEKQSIYNTSQKNLLTG